MNRSRKSQKNSITRKNKVFYTGIHAKKSGKHSIKEFMKIMEKDKKGCSKFAARKTCRSCVKATRILRSNKKNQTISKKNAKKLDKYLEACEKCTAKSKKRCTLHEHLEYSGAELIPHK